MFPGADLPGEEPAPRTPPCLLQAEEEAVYEGPPEQEAFYEEPPLVGSYSGAGARKGLHTQKHLSRAKFSGGMQQVLKHMHFWSSPVL